MKRLTRREFIRCSGGAAAASAGWAALVPLASEGPRATTPNEKIGVALIGCGEMGRTDLLAMADTGRVEIPLVCDVDDARAAGVAAEIERRRMKRPRTERDFRRVLDRTDVDAVIVATPDRWHAPMTIHACEAGKDVYVEVPACREIAEGPAMVRAARANGRVVQLGAQLRSTAHIRSAVDFVRSGRLGRIGLCRAWMCGPYDTLSDTRGGRALEGFDDDLLLKPAAARPFHPARFQRTGRWFGDNGSAQLGNHEVHLLDVVRWAMDVGWPQTVTSTGGVFNCREGRDTSDTRTVTYDFPAFRVVWEHSRWPNDAPGTGGLGLAFHGSEATLVVDYRGWKVEAEPSGRIVARATGVPDHAAHVRDFLDCIRTRRPPAADVETGFQTAAWCLTGIVAQRLGRTVRFDASTHRFIEDPVANSLPTRPYREPWALPEDHLDRQGTA